MKYTKLNVQRLKMISQYMKYEVSITLNLGSVLQVFKDCEDYCVLLLSSFFSWVKRGP